MRTSAYLSSKGVAVLKSPLINLKEDNTVKFYYYTDCSVTCTQTLTSLTLSCELNDGSVKTVWKVRNIHVYEYLPAVAKLPSGTRRLIFTLAGGGVEGGIDEITIYSSKMYRGKADMYNYSQFITI